MLLASPAGTLDTPVSDTKFWGFWLRFQEKSVHMADRVLEVRGRQLIPQYRKVG